MVVPTAPRGQFAGTPSFNSITAHLLSHDLGSERPGRVNERGGTTRHAIEPRQDPHKAAKQKFVVEVVKQINSHAEAGDFDQLVPVASGHALHDLREALGAKATGRIQGDRQNPRRPAESKATGRIVGSLGKDLTRTPDHDLTSHLAEWWGRPAVV